MRESPNRSPLPVWIPQGEEAGSIFLLLADIVEKVVVTVVGIDLTLSLKLEHRSINWFVAAWWAGPLPVS